MTASLRVSGYICVCQYLMGLLLFTCFHKAVKCSLTTEHLKGAGSDRVPVYKLAAEFDRSWTPTCAPYNARANHNMFPLVAPHTTGMT